MRDGTILDFSKAILGSDGLDRYAIIDILNVSLLIMKQMKKISDIEEPDIWEVY